MYNVLIVEDEVPVRNTIVESVDWEEIGLTIAYAAGDGQEALDYLEDHQVDLILTDIYMPFIDGMELIRRVRLTNNYCKVVFLTGYNEFDYAKEAIELEASKYLLKPITKDELTKVLIEMKEELDSALNLKKNLTRLESEYEKQRLFMQNKLLHDIIYGFIPSDRIKQACENLTCDFGAPYYSIGIVEVLDKEEVGKKVWNDDYTLLHYAMLNICEEILESEKKAKVLLGDNGKIIIVFTAREANGFSDQAYNHLTEILHSISRIYEMPMTAGLSNAYETLGDLRIAYNEAIAAIDYAVLEGNNRVIVKSDIEPNSFVNHDRLNDTIEQIITNVKINNLDRVQEYMKLFFEQIKFDKYGLNEIKTLLLTLMTKTFDVYNQITLDESLKQTLDFKLVEKIYLLESLTSIETAMFETFWELSLKLKKSREDDKNHLVLEAIQYVEKDYANPAIDLNLMSQMLHVSTSYFSRIFKAAKEETFIEYLTAFRINKAKELLKATDKKVYEIATDIGYEDAHYFSYNFRKHVGTTPLKYRKA